MLNFLELLTRFSSHVLCEQYGYNWPIHMNIRKTIMAQWRNDDEDAKEELYSLVTVAEIPAEGLKGLGTKVIDDDEE
ncbi:hypothetical protein ES288_D05G031500v1 [Gossypium darwinii]|uniref:Uncharacterized protein n=1 Tax=Gossypium darwinii TaxID=34276 RepID=A0A5D2CG30_GOSDA|nr:hypothetical protein ES288_D05G031500v1 [Gossypium darwinii]